MSLGPVKRFLQKNLARNNAWSKVAAFCNKPGQDKFA